MRGRPLLAALAAAVLAGCSLEPAYVRPQAPIDAAWPASAGGVAVGELPLQEAFFTDARLRELQQLALANNRDLRVLAAGVEEARALHGDARAALFPAVGVAATTARSNVPSLDASGDSAGRPSSLFQATGGFTAFELDLFGRLRSRRNAAWARFEATEADYAAARIALVGEVAGTWLRLRADRSLLALAESTERDQQRQAGMMRSGLSHGANARIEVHQSDVQLQIAAVQAAGYRMAVARDLNALRVLVGQPLPQALLPDDGLEGRGVTAEIAAGLPSSLLQRRPDIAAAEARLRASNADIGAARAAFFPAISLTAALGSLSSELASLFTGGSRYWTAGADLGWTLFDGGGRRARLAASRARNAAQIAAYESTVQAAFREVADALAAHQQMQAQADAQARLVADYREVARQTRLRFDAGLDSYYAAMDAQRSLFEAQQRWLELEYARQNNQILLYKALGGGWNGTADAVTAAR